LVAATWLSKQEEWCKGRDAIWWRLATNHTRSTEEVPVVYDETKVFVDMISYIMKSGLPNEPQRYGSSKVFLKVKENGLQLT
jgi:hypothetical protein